MNTVPAASNVRNSSAYPAGYGNGMEPAQYGVYDKPADRRLAPWITLGSLILMVCCTSWLPHPHSMSNAMLGLWSSTHHLHLRQARHCELFVGLPHQWNHPGVSGYHRFPRWYFPQVSACRAVLLGLPWRLHCICYSAHHQCRPP